MFRFWIDNKEYKKWRRAYTQLNRSTKCTIYRMCTIHIYRILVAISNDKKKKKLTIHPTDGDKVKAIELCQCLSFLWSRSLFLGGCIISSGGLLKLFHFDMFEKKKIVPGFLFTTISSQLNSFPPISFLLSIFFLSFA